MKMRFKYTGPEFFYADSWQEAEEVLLSGLEEDEDKEYSDEDVKEAARNQKADEKLEAWKEREIA